MQDDKSPRMLFVLNVNYFTLATLGLVVNVGAAGTKSNFLQIMLQNFYATNSVR